jgi:hypothetical protein
VAPATSAILGVVLTPEAYQEAVEAGLAVRSRRLSQLVTRWGDAASGSRPMLAGVATSRSEDMPFSRRTTGSLMALLLGGVALCAHAVEFNEKVQAPMARTGTELKALIEQQRIASPQGTDVSSALARVRSASAARQQFDITWLLGRSVDAHLPLPELEALGFVPRHDGGYSIDTQAHPEWRSLSESLWQIVKPEHLDRLAPTLTARGILPADLDAIRQYLTTHDLDRMRSRFKLDLAISTSRMARKLQRLKRPIDDRFMWSYFYQRAAGITEVERQWAQGLLDALDPRAQRILASYLAEGPGTWTIVPTNDSDAIAYERDLLLRPDFESMARKAFEEGQL